MNPPVWRRQHGDECPTFELHNIERLCQLRNLSDLLAFVSESKCTPDKARFLEPFDLFIGIRAGLQLDCQLKTFFIPSHVCCVRGECEIGAELGRVMPRISLGDRFVLMSAIYDSTWG